MWSAGLAAHIPASVVLCLLNVPARAERAGPAWRMRRSADTLESCLRCPWRPVRHRIGTLDDGVPGRWAVLDERKLAVLRAIVRDYVSTMEPVGSKSLVDRHHLDVSPATIRNDMAVLEEQGYITQPHTSAGRIPTDKGYRLFVDRLSGIKPLSSAERRAIETFLAGAYDLDDVVLRTVRLLAQLTRQVALVQYPSLTRSAVRHIELVPMAPQRAILNACLDGRRASEAASVVAELPERVQPGDRQNAAAVFSMILDTLVEHHDERIVVSGAANLTPADFSQGLREVLESLEEQVVLMRLLGESGDETTVTVRIGSENQVEGLRSTSVVAAAYGGTGERVALARLGVVGPTRMDYPTAIGAVRTVARYVSQILAGS